MNKTLAGIRQNESNVIYGNTAQKTKKSLTENFIILGSDITVAKIQSRKNI